MFSLSDIKRYINTTPAINKYKPWWEVIFDLLILGLFLILMLSWSRSFTVESGGLLCVPLEGDMYLLQTSDSRYTQSRCYIETNIKYVQYYPYIIFMQWGLLFLCQITWAWIPTVVSKFKYFDDILNEIVSVPPVFLFNYSNLGLIPEIDYTDENKAKLRVVHDKLFFVLKDRKYISIIYLRKIQIMILLLCLCIILTVSWISAVGLFNSDFSCLLNSTESKKEMPLSVCNNTTYLFIHGIMIVHILFLLVMMVLSIKGLMWHRKINSNFHYTRSLFEEDCEGRYRGLPGYDDLIMFLELCKTNIRDGQLILVIFSYVLNYKYDHKSQTLVDNKGIYFVDNTNLEKYSFWEEWNIINFMLSEIGLKFQTYDQSPNRLFEILSESNKNESNPLHLCINEDIRDRITCELIQNYESYISLIQISNESRPKSSNIKECTTNLYDLYKHISIINRQENWPDHIIIQAASNIFKKTIVLVSVYSPTEGDIFSYDVIKPFSSLGIFERIIIAFIRPHYYYALENVPNITFTQSRRQLDFISHRNYRDRVRVASARKFSTIEEDDLNCSKIQKKKLKFVKEQDNVINNLYQGMLLSKSYLHLDRKMEDYMDDISTIHPNDSTEPIEEIGGLKMEA